jgi:hypothetical protein
MFARTVAPAACCAATVPNAPRWQPVNCVAVLPVYTISSSSIERMPYSSGKPTPVDSTLMVVSPA